MTSRSSWPPAGPNSCSVAHLALLDTERASNVTADALARLNRTWNDVVDAGRPGEQARAAVLHAALTTAGTPPPPPPRDGSDHEVGCVPRAVRDAGTADPVTNSRFLLLV